MLTSSAAKPLGAIEVLAAEAEARGDALRAAVLCDAEVGERQPEGSPLALTGGARGVLRALGDDLRTAGAAPAARDREGRRLPARTTPSACAPRSARPR